MQGQGGAVCGLEENSLSRGNLVSSGLMAGGRELQRAGLPEMEMVYLWVFGLAQEAAEHISLQLRLLCLVCKWKEFVLRVFRGSYV